MRVRRSDTHLCGVGGGILRPWEDEAAEHGVGVEEKCRERGRGAGSVADRKHEEAGKHSSFRRARGAMPGDGRGPSTGTVSYDDSNSANSTMGCQLGQELDV